MAAKIKEGLRDITQGVVERLKGGPKYADNLLGESLQDQLRKATSKELMGPSEELTSQIIDTINQDVANGKDSREVVGLLKKRLRTDNPHKQWLAVLLVGRVMHDCASSLAPHQEELLQEVARVMTHPAKQDSSAGLSTRQAAKDLLRSYGRAGTSAFRAVARSTIADASTAAQIAAAANSQASGEAASLVDEVTALIEQARANTELLSEMLVADRGQGTAPGTSPQPSASNGPGDDFEDALTREVVAEVRELRGLFDVYLEQLQAHSSAPQVEAILIRALEAVDLLDGALALHQDVASDQRQIEQQATAGHGGQALKTAGNSGSTAVTGTASNTAGDLISLDDFGGLLPPPPPVLGGNPAAMPPAGQLAAAAEATAARPSPADPFASLDPIAVQSSLLPAAAQPQPTLSPQPPAASTLGGQPSYSSPYGSYPTLQQQQQQSTYGVYGTPSAMLYGGMSPPAAAAVNPNNPFATSAVPTLLQYGTASLPAVAPAASTAVPPAVTSNPFAALPAAPSGSNSAAMDSEWAMFFANRTAGAAAVPQQH